ncbi:MAG: anthranilate synthase component I [Butyrivibrio sp.]|nr:anthranilate synthase component I [Acetatifactor muris]MCM1558479.1 anthranilate synthase component I [Butyrivibrio sp.]
MKLNLTLEECKKLAARGEYGLIPLSTELFADICTPMEMVRILKKVSSHVFLLESADADKRWGRYSFLGYDPLLEITCYDGTVKMKTALTTQTTRDDIRSCIRDIIRENRSPELGALPPFTGGLVGYFSYDYIKYSEPGLKLDARDEEGFQDVNLMLFHKVVAFDNDRHKIQLIVNVKTDDLEVNYNKAVLELEEMRQLILRGEKMPRMSLKLKSDFKPLFSEEEYCRMVEKGKHYIKEGDIFQVVLSNRLEAEMEGSLLDAYRVLRIQNPSPYMFYFSGGDGEIAGASPETLVKLEKDKLYTFPLAGTRPRGRTEEEDRELEQELLTDEKEKAEHNMLVDLGRNDIGKLSRIGTVQVEKYMSVERYSHVMHLGSTVSGIIREDRDALDAVDAILPAGTLSGAPKLRACEIINELENNKRGIYGGAIGYISFTGSLDTCIAIRLAFSKNGKVFVRSGAGIVADSVPEKEYRECIQKAAAVKNAIETAQEGMEDDFVD